MNAEAAAFLDSLKSGIPPAAAAPILRAVWHGLRGEWETAHQIAQDAMRLITGQGQSVPVGLESAWAFQPAAGLPWGAAYCIVKR
jgi:hypothetical protein